MVHKVGIAKGTFSHACCKLLNFFEFFCAASTTLKKHPSTQSRFAAILWLRKLKKWRKGGDGSSNQSTCPRTAQTTCGGWCLLAQILKVFRQPKSWVWWEMSWRRQKCFQSDSSSARDSKRWQTRVMCCATIFGGRNPKMLSQIWDCELENAELGWGVYFGRKFFWCEFFHWVKSLSWAFCCSPSFWTLSWNRCHNRN